MKDVKRFTVLFAIISLMVVFCGCPQPSSPNKSTPSKEEPEYKYTTTWYVKNDTRYHGYFVFQHNVDGPDYRFVDFWEETGCGKTTASGIVTYYSDNLPPKTMAFQYDVGNAGGGESVTFLIKPVSMLYC